MTRLAGFGIVFGVVAALLLGLVSDADAQRRRRRRAPEPPANGTLVVQSQVDGAEVLVDEATVGFTPLDPLELPPGEHTVRVRRPGYTEFDDVVVVAAGREAVVPVELIALAMVVTVRSTPDESRVFVDGTFRGNTPIELELIEGEHELRVAAPRFREHTRTITAIPGELELVDVTLEALPEELLNPRAPEWYEEPVTWIAIGGGAAALAVIIVIVAVVTQQPGPPLQDFCGDNDEMCDLVVRPSWEF